MLIFDYDYDEYLVVCLVMVRANGFVSPCVGVRLITTSPSILLYPLAGCIGWWMLDRCAGIEEGFGWKV